jgi:hypothetical protein
MEFYTYSRLFSESDSWQWSQAQQGHREKRKTSRKTLYFFEFKKITVLTSASSHQREKDINYHVPSNKLVPRLQVQSPDKSVKPIKMQWLTASQLSSP